MALTIDRTAELIFLQKVLCFIKFECEDYEARYLAVSPYSGDLLKRISSELTDYYKSIQPNYQSQFGRIETMPHYLAGIKTHLSHIDNWSTLTANIQVDVILDLAAPFTIDQQNISLFLESI